MVIAKTNKPLLILITLLIVGSLVNINIFGPTTMSAYFFYTILGALLAVIAGVGFLKSKQSVQINNPLPILLLGLLAVYYIINGLINTQGGINLRHYIILVDAVLLITYCMLISKGSISFLAIGKIVSFVAAIESIICILQQLGIVASQDNLFKVTGSNVNPNVTAMFLAMAVPALLLVLFKGSKTYRTIAIVSSILCIIAMILLQCRTAFIGAAFGTALILNQQYQLLNNLRSKFNKAGLIICFTFALCLITYAFFFLYHSKQASSDGRLFIWKVSLQAIAQKPILGSGYGQFEHDYNLAQAKYFATGTATQQEIMNAGYVHMSYNEFLENLFEGGIIGLVLFVVLLAVLLAPLFRRGVGVRSKEQGVSLSQSKAGKMEKSSTSIGFNKRNLTAADHAYYAYAGIATFTIMCFFNFTVQAMPVRALFILYAAVCCTLPYSRHCEALRGMKQSNLNSAFVRVLTLIRSVFSNGAPFKVGMLAFSLLLFLQLLTLSKAYNLCKTIMESSGDLGVKETCRELGTLEKDMNESTYYWVSYGNILLAGKYTASAVQKLKSATRFSSNPNIYLEIANCYNKMGKYQEAIDAINIAKNIEPHHFAPLYSLMKVYKNSKDTTDALLTAKAIIVMQPKVASDKVTFYKKEATAITNLLKVRS